MFGKKISGSNLGKSLLKGTCVNELLDFEGGQSAAYSQNTVHLDNSLNYQFSIAPCEPDHWATGNSTVNQQRPPDDQAFDISVVDLQRTLQHFSRYHQRPIHAFGIDALLRRVFDSWFGAYVCV